MKRLLFFLATAAPIALAGCGDAPRAGRKASSPAIRRTAGARARSETGTQDPPARPAPYSVRSFTPAGTGTLTLNRKRHTFEIADCRLEPEKLPSGYIRDVWVSGAGIMGGQPYFLTLSRARKGKRAIVSLGIFSAPLPAALGIGGYNLSRPQAVDAMEIVANVDSLRSMGLVGLQANQILVESRVLTTTGAFRLQRFDQGTFSNAPPVEATLELSCEAES